MSDEVAWFAGGSASAYENVAYDRFVYSNIDHLSEEW